MHPNIFVGVKEGSALYRKWYFEVVIDHVETVSHTPHIRIGWANTEGFLPFPGAGEHWGCNGVGDDLYSYGFDGINLWTGLNQFSIYSLCLFSLRELVSSQGFRFCVRKYCRIHFLQPGLDF